MSNEKYTGQNAGTQALQDFFADMAAGFAVQEQVADTTIVELDEGAELDDVGEPIEIKFGSDMIIYFKNNKRKKWYASARKMNGESYGVEVQAPTEAGVLKKIKEYIRDNKTTEGTEDSPEINMMGFKAGLKGIPSLNGIPMFEELDEAKKKTSMKMEMDTNGNRVLRISSPEGSFTIQTNTNLPEIHRRSIELDTKEAFEYVDAYLKKNGSTGKRQAVWNAYGSYSGFDNTTNESAEITDHSKRSKEELDLHAQMRRERDKRLAAMGVHQKRLVKEDSLDEVSYDVTATVKGEDNVLIVSTDNGLKANKAKQWAKDQGFTNIVLHKFADLPPQYKLKESLYQEDLDEAKRKYDMSTYAISLYKAAYNLFDDGLKESDAEAAGKMLNAKAHNGYITMEDLTDIAKHFGLAVGSGLFKEGFEHADKQVEELTEADLQELFTFFKKETKPVAAVDMGGDDVTEKWTPNIESMVFGKYSFMLWKNKTKSEWYGLAYNTRNGETKKTLESSTSKSAIIKQLKAMVTGHEPVTEEVEGVDVDPKTVVEGIIEKYQTAKTKSAELVIEGLEQLIEYIEEETPPLEATSNDWSPEQETVVRGKFTLVVWKHKTKSEWYGYSYLTKTGELLVSFTRKTKPEVVLDLRKFAVDLPVTE